MKKSLVVLTALAVVVAFAAVGFAKGPVQNCAPAAKTDFVVKPGVGKNVAPPTLPAGKMTKPECKTVPCVMPISVPGKVAMGKVPVPPTVDIEVKLYDVLCLGNNKGACPIGCPPFTDKVTWNCEWKTLVQTGKKVVKAPFPMGLPPNWVEKPVKFKTVTVPPAAPTCPF